MRSGFRIGAVLAATAALFAGPAVMREMESEADFRRFFTRRLGFKPAQFRQSKGKPTKRKLKPNRLHVSRRVRRKHRRAAQ